MSEEVPQQYPDQPQQQYPDQPQQPEQQPQQQPQQDYPAEAQEQPAAQPSGGSTSSNEDKKILSSMLSAQKKVGNTSQLLYVAPISDRIALSHFLYFQTFPCSFALCHSNELKQSTYVHLYEDRLEWDYPSSCCSTIYSNSQVLYLDRDIAEYQTIPYCCNPFCTHCSVAPTCFDLFGEMLMLSGTQSCCWVKNTRPWGIPCQNTPLAYSSCCLMPFCGKPLPCLNKEWLFLPNLKNANELKFRVRQQRKKLMDAKKCDTCVEGIMM